MIAVKEKLPHGEWGKWLKEKVDFSQEHARRFMKIATECANSTSMLNLPPTKVFALLDLPREEREEFVQSNPVNEMSTRELQQAIKDREKALKEKADLEVKLEAAEKEAQEKGSLYKTATESSEKLRKELEETKKQLEEAQASGNDEEVSRLQASLREKEDKLSESGKKIEDLERQLKEKPIDAAVVTIEKIPDEVQKELDELRKDKQSPAILKYSVYFEELVGNFRALLGLLAEIQKSDQEEYERYKNAMKGLIGKMSERL